MPDHKTTSATPWTWRDFEREAQAALGPFEPEYVLLAKYSAPPYGDAPPFNTPVWPDEPPYTRWIACYAVPGGSEGWHVYVDLIRGDRLDRRLLMLSAKFWRLDDALKAAEVLTRIIWAERG
jgi:hypothetical protein